MPTRISVVIPVKNDSRELSRCLAAIRRQTRLPDEVIVVNNGSSDDSAGVALRAGATLLDCPDGAIPAASACGYDYASGDLILRLDADCVPDPVWIAAVEDAFAARPRVSALTGGARFIDGPVRLRGPLATAYLVAYAVFATPALGHLPMFGSNLAVRREAWDEVKSVVHRQGDRIHDDLDLAFHFGGVHRIGYLRGAHMGMSMRPFRSGRSFLRRVRRGFHTVFLHWPHDFPPSRWLRLLRTARRSRQDVMAMPREPLSAR